MLESKTIAPDANQVTPEATVSPFEVSLEPLREIVTGIGTETAIEVLDKSITVFIQLLTAEDQKWEREFLQNQLFNLNEMRRAFYELGRLEWEHLYAQESETLLN